MTHSCDHSGGRVYNMLHAVSLTAWLSVIPGKTKQEQNYGTNKEKKKLQRKVAHTHTHTKTNTAWQLVI